MKEWLYVREKSKKARAAVSMRKDRRGYERNTNVGTNDLHLGGGGGEGEGVLSGNRELVSREGRSEEHTSELQSLMRISYAVFCLKKKNSHLSNQTSNST